MFRCSPHRREYVQIYSPQGGAFLDLIPQRHNTTQPQTPNPNPNPNQPQTRIQTILNDFFELFNVKTRFSICKQRFKQTKSFFSNLRLLSFAKNVDFFEIFTKSTRIQTIRNKFFELFNVKTHFLYVNRVFNKNFFFSNLGLLSFAKKLGFLKFSRKVSEG